MNKAFHTRASFEWKHDFRCRISAIEVRYVVCCCMKAHRAVTKNIFIHPPFNHFFLKFHFKLPSSVSGGQDWELHSKARSKKRVERSHSFLSLQAKKPQQRSRMLSRGPRSHGDLSCSCVATAAAQVRLPGCSAVCGAPEHLGQCRKHRGRDCGWWWWQSNAAFWLFTPVCTHSHHEDVFI